MLVELGGVKRYFEKVKAVDDVSFGFDAGMVCGFIGPNGAGKTTTMRLLATLDVPEAGEITVCGWSVVDYPDRVRGRLGFMPDHLGTYSYLTVWEYLDFFARTYGLRGQKRTDRVASVMDFTDLWPLADREASKLSKGMKQRLSLGRALINDPDVLVLDEPAAGLDPRARIELLELIKELGGNGKAILISSHILAELSKICDHVVIIDKGKLKLTGTMGEVKEHVRSLRLNHGAAVAADVEVANKVTITFAAEPENVEKLLLEQPGVHNARVLGKVVVVEHVGSQYSLANLLKALVLAELPVIGFRTEEEDLEDVFMAVTDGESS